MDKTQSPLTKPVFRNVEYQVDLCATLARIYSIIYITYIKPGARDDTLVSILFAYKIPYRCAHLVLACSALRQSACESILLQIILCTSSKQQSNEGI